MKTLIIIGIVAVGIILICYCINILLELDRLNAKNSRYYNPNKVGNSKANKKNQPTPERG